MSGHDLTILQAAQAILREQGLERVRQAASLEERMCANQALLAAVCIEDYLRRVDELALVASHGWET